MARYIIATIVISVITTLSACGDQKTSINVAVASNFESTLEKLVTLYNNQQEKPLDINIIAGPSGVLANQIIHDAPFDVFLSADQHKAQLIFDHNHLSQPPIVYAIGQLVLWIPHINDKGNCMDKLSTLESLTIANPETAPYGLLAQSILLKHKNALPKIIYSTNVSQAYLYTQQQFSDAGFVAKSMISTEDSGCLQTFVDSTLKQSMVLINPKAKTFYDFLSSEKAQSLIKQSGYRIQI